MTRDLEYNITAQDNGVTISDYLKKQGFSHAVTVQLKKIPESILLNGKWEYMSTRLNDGDCLFIHFEETEGSENIVATNLPLSICYEDEDILVVNKPADMPIHPSMNNYEHTRQRCLPLLPDTGHSLYVPLCQPLRPGHHRAHHPCQTSHQFRNIKQRGVSPGHKQGISCHCERFHRG